MENFLQELRITFRTWAKNPAFAVMIVFCIALAVGANTAIFAVANRMLLHPFSYPQSDRLVTMREFKAQSGRWPVTAFDYQEWKQRTHVFQDIAASRDAPPYDLIGSGEPVALRGYRFAWNMFNVLGVKPILGRTFLPEEDKPGATPVVVLSHKLWVTQFNKDPNILGKTLNLSGTIYTVIGVMPPDFVHPSLDTLLWAPLALPDSAYQNRRQHSLRLVGRLRDGVSLQQAQRELQSVSLQLQQEHPDTNGGWVAEARPIREGYVEDIRPAILVLIGAAALLLLITLANVTNLMLARMRSRIHEVALRVALGANRADLLRRSLAESLLLAIFGGAFGLLLAASATKALVAQFPEHLNNIAIPKIDSIPIDWRVALFCAAVSIVGALLVAIPPALGSLPNVAESLKDSTSGAGSSRSKHGLRRALVVLEIAVAVMVLIGSGLAIKSFLVLQKMQYGFDTSHILSMYVTMPARKYKDPESRRQYARRLTEELSHVPGVDSVGTISYLPLSGYGSGISFAIEGSGVAEQDRPQSDFNIVSTSYFPTMGIDVVAGRNFASTDIAGGPEVAVVNQTLARKFFGGQDAVGKRVNLSSEDKPEWAQIIGVVHDVRHYGLDQEVQPEFYLTYEQQPDSLAAFVLRTKGDPNQLASAARHAIWNVDNEQTVERVVSMELAASESMAIRRVTMSMLALFGITCLLLASVGTYGVISQSVTQRTREIGVRMALGATRSRVLAMVMSEGARLTVAGVIIGIVSAFACTRLMKTLLYGVSEYDALTFVTIPLLLAAVALLACFIPARRATKVDPMVALRYE